VYAPPGSVPPPSYLTSCHPTKSNLHFDSSLETVIKELSLYKLLIFHNPNLISISISWIAYSKNPSRSEALLNIHNKFIFYGEGLLAPRPTPKLEDHPFSFVRGCLFSIFAAGGRSSIRNLRTHHAVVTGTPPNTVISRNYKEENSVPCYHISYRASIFME
jgi:hypothetical protein